MGTRTLACPVQGRTLHCGGEIMVEIISVRELVRTHPPLSHTDKHKHGCEIELIENKAQRCARDDTRIREAGADDDKMSKHAKMHACVAGCVPVVAIARGASCSTGKLELP